jgi:hypothetical protein
MNILFMEQGGDIYNTMKKILKFISCNLGWVIQSFIQKIWIFKWVKKFKIFNFDWILYHIKSNIEIIISQSKGC